MSANVSILGNLGRAVESRINENGTFVANFTFASNSVKNTPRGSEKKTDWFRVTAIGKQAETLAEYAKKGTRLLIQGSLSLSAWKDRQGKPQYSADLLLQDFQFAGGTDKSEMNQPAATGAPEYSVETEIASEGADDVQEIAQPAGVY